MRHEHAPLSLAQRQSRVVAPAPLFTALLNYRHGASGPESKDVEGAWEGIEFLGGEERTNYPLVLSVDDWGDGFGLVVQVRVPVAAERVCGVMQRAQEELVTALESAPETPVRRLDVLAASERHRLLVEWNATEINYPSEKAIHELFEEQAAAHRMP